jgi:phage terminase small subunit
MASRLPRSVKVLRGTLRAHRDNPAAPIIRVGKVPPPPKRLSATQRRIWLELTEELDTLSVYAPSDRTAFELLVTMLALVADAPADTPATATARLLQAAAAQLGRFGLDPASRDRVTAIHDPGTSAEADLFGAPRLVTPPGGKP